MSIDYDSTHWVIYSHGYAQGFLWIRSPDWKFDRKLEDSALAETAKVLKYLREVVGGNNNDASEEAFCKRLETPGLRVYVGTSNTTTKPLTPLHMARLLSTL